jgi:hypothetical protein
MTARLIDDVAIPMKRLKLLPEELVTLKVIMFCQFGNNIHTVGKFKPLFLPKLLKFRSPRRTTRNIGGIQKPSYQGVVRVLQVQKHDQL